MKQSETSLVALHRERDQAIEGLSEAFSRDLLDVDEFERRISQAHKATSADEIATLTRDLVPRDSTSLVKTAPVQATALAEHRPKSRNVIAIVSGATRSGQWRVPEKLRVTAVMGGVELDFREAAFSPGLTTVSIFAAMGGVEIIVPPGLAVDCDGTAILGGFDSMDRAPVIPDPEAPLLRIKGTVVLGGFEISTRLPGESSRDARRRRRRENKERSALER